MSDANPNESPAATPAGPPPGYPGAPTPPPAPAYSAADYAPPAGQQYAPAGEQPYPQPAYGAPAYPQPPQQPYGYATPYGYAPPAQKTNTLAIVSLIASIVGFTFLPFIASVVAVITGHMSLRQLKTSGEAGRGLALSGTIVGWVGVGLSVIGVILFVIWIMFIIGIASSTGTSYYDYP